MAKWAIMVSVVLWVVTIGAVIAVNAQSQSRAQRKMWSFGVIMGAVIVQIGIAAYDDSQRRKALIEALTQRGFVPNTADGSPAQALHYVPEQRHHSFKVVLSALGTIGNRPAHFAEYKYTIGHGKGAQNFRLTELAVDVNPAAVPLRLARRRGVFKKAANLETGLEKINKEWQVADGRPDDASLRLSLPSFGPVLGTPQPNDEQWCVVEGWASLTVRKAMKADQLDRTFGRVIDFAVVYAPEA